ncbi:MAG: acyl-CoA reductase [Flavobacteriales bacterium]
MTLNQTTAAFVRLGKYFSAFGQAPEEREHADNLDLAMLSRFDELIVREKFHNGWFTEENVRRSFAALGSAMTEEGFSSWLSSYRIDQIQPKKVGLILAGNIPLVGFHDVLSTLMCGHTAVIKTSRDDNRLLPSVLDLLFSIEEGFKEQVVYVAMKLPEIDAIIATGSGNTARHFDYYFRHLPRVIRRNRTSVAVLDGTETDGELAALGHDIFDYFGLGCRNVTKLYIPVDFDLDRIFGALFAFRETGQHNKYANNYDYHKALWLLNQEDLIENGFLIVKEDPALVSPVGSLFYERYSDLALVERTLTERADELQCVVSHRHIPFGGAQQPKLNDYADGVDTIDFLLKLEA